MANLNNYLAAFRTLHVNRVGGRASPHKPCMLLAVLGLAESGHLERNEIRFEPNITGTFTRVMVSIVNGTSGAQIALKDLNEEHLDAAQSGPGTAYEDASVLTSAREDSIGDPRGIESSVELAHVHLLKVVTGDTATSIGATGRGRIARVS